MPPRDVSGVFWLEKMIFLSHSEVLKTNLGLSFNAFEQGLQEVPFLGMF